MHRNVTSVLATALCNHPEAFASDLGDDQSRNLCLVCTELCWLKIAAEGNWIHIHYQSKLQAKKVLSKNGKVFGGSIMVGVAPCIDKVGAC